MNIFGNQYGEEGTKKGGQYFLIGRVTNIVLGPFKGGSRERDPDYVSQADIGKIQYQLLYSPLGKRKTKQISDSGNKPAYPLSGFLKHYPLVGEIVLIMTGPSPGLNDDYNSQRLYYFPPYALWNDSNHNAFPDLEEYADFVNKTASQPGYGGSSITGSNMPLGYTFDEKYIRNMQPFEGDVILQSRFGQSIRFSSTIPSRKNENTWSDFGKNGDPITIITNQQANRPGRYKFDLTVEDINLDGSSIYMTSTQQIDIPALVGFPLRSFGVSINPIVSKVTQTILPPVSNLASSAANQDQSTFDKDTKSTDDIPPIIPDPDTTGETSEKYTVFGFKTTIQKVLGKEYEIQMTVSENETGKTVFDKKGDSKKSMQDAYNEIVKLLKDFQSKQKIKFTIPTLDSIEGS